MARPGRGYPLRQLLGRGPAIQEAPQQVAGLRLWLAARKETGLSNGNGVQTPTNWAGLGNDLTQATGSNQPTYQTNVVDGQAVFRFAVASAQRWAANSGNVVTITNAASGMTLFVVAKVAAFASVTQQFINFDNNVAGSVRYKYGYRFISGNPDEWYASGRRLDADTAVNATAGADVDTNWHLHTVVPRWSDGLIDFYREQTADATGITWTSAGTVSATNSAFVSVGAKDGGTEALNGDIAELLVYDRVLSSTDRQDIWSYLLGFYPSLAPTVTWVPVVAGQYATVH